MFVKNFFSSVKQKKRGLNNKIIQEICRIMREPAFIEARMAFFEKNAEKLEDEVNGAEESKTNSTNLHQEYISILKANIHFKIAKNFSGNQIDAFYIDYEQNQD